MLLYDSENAGAIPADAPAVCLYGDIATPADWARFSRTSRLVVASRGPLYPPRYPGGAVVADAAPADGHFTPAQAASWVAEERRTYPEARVGLYVNAATWPTLETAVADLGAPAPDWWVAAWIAPGASAPTLPPRGAVAWQYARTGVSGGDYDLSCTTSTWPPAPMPVAPIMEDPMAIAIAPTGAVLIEKTGQNGHLLIFKTTVADVGSGAPTVEVTDANDAIGATGDQYLVTP